MAEINNIIAEASQDLQTIEDFVNLPAGSDVRPRLLPSVNVGTLAGTRDAIFRAGGLPAEPFETKSQMEIDGAELADGQLAMVHNDTANNGLYVKTAGAWVKSNYDIASNINSKTNGLLLNRATDVNINTKDKTITITGRLVRGTNSYPIVNKEVSYVSTSSASAVIAYDTVNDTLVNVWAADVATLPSTHIVFSGLSVVFNKPALSNISEYYIDGEYVGGRGYNTNALVISDASAIHLDFNNNRVVLDRTIWIPYKQYRIYITPQTINLSTSRDKTAKNVVIYDIINDRVVIKAVSTNYTLSVNEVVLFAYHESEKTVYGLDAYTLNGEVAVKGLARESALHMALFDEGALDINFSKNQLVLSSEMWIPLADRRVKIDAQTVDINPDRVVNGSMRHLILADIVNNSLSVVDGRSNFKMPENHVLIGAAHERDSKLWGLNGATINGRKPSGDASNKTAVSFGYTTDGFINLDVTDSYIEGQDAPYLQIIRSWTVYQWYDDLVDRFPDYVSRVNLGKDTSGTKDIFEYIFKPPRYNKIYGKYAEMPRIMIQALHNEQINFVFPYIMMREICENWQNHEGLEGLRWGTEIRVIPVLNPWGVDNGSRVNSSGVDINRNYPYGWEFNDSNPAISSGSEPLSEAETAASYNEMLSFQPHIMIDCHSFGGFKESGRSAWYTSLNDDDLIYINDVATASYSNYAKKYPWLEPINNLHEVHDSRNFLGTAADARHSLGILGGTVEYAWSLRGNADAEVKGNSIAVNFASDSLLHFIRRCIAHLLTSR